MFCSNCGHTIAGDQQGSAFCPNCGATIEAPAAQAPNQMQGQDPAQGPGGYYGTPAPAGAPAMARPSSGGVTPKHIIIGGVGLAGIILIVVLLMVFLGGNPLHGTWTEEGGWGETIEFRSRGRGTIREGFMEMPFEWRTDTMGNMDVLFITINDPFNLFGASEEWIVEYRFMGNNILQFRDLHPWESNWWDTFLRVN